MAVNGKTVMITGASRGIGEAAARLFAAEGANVALVARGGDAIGQIAGDIGAKAMAIPCDVGRYEDLAEAVAKAESAFSSVDILINNAAILGSIAHLADSDIEEFGAAIDINLKGVFYGTKLVLPGMVAKGAGTILNISSGAAHNPVEGWSAYCSSKAGAHMLTRMTPREYADRGIRALGLVRD
ncbi:MAG: SDR family NAD(P)-dependent oxidoreductase [Boseongicola sp.]|nr:MAG: SDR family NAD(P)-dependent oxidoreductase [Boseongicola sp.]